MMDWLLEAIERWWGLGFAIGGAGVTWIASNVSNRFQINALKDEVHRLSLRVAALETQSKQEAEDVSVALNQINVTMATLTAHMSSMKETMTEIKTEIRTKPGR